MSSRRWKIGSADASAVAALAAAAGLPKPIAQVLVQRGFRSPETVGEFIHPRLADLADPFLLPDMQKAASRLWNAIDAGETITVFGDYDVDGVTSAALMTRVLAALGAGVKTFIPDRLDEGYGLSRDALERCLAEHRSSVVVSVDCGVNSVDSVGWAQQQGVDVIVTDHHMPAEVTAPACALVNPRLGTVPSLENLSGVGVAFKLAHALVKLGRGQKKPAVSALDLRDYLDIAALGTMADIVPLTGENRIIVRHGLARLNQTRWVGMQALKEVAGLRGEAETWHLGFQLGPRINAAGRIGQPMQALELLVTEDAAAAARIARRLDETNTERRRIEREMADEAFAEIDPYFDPEKHFGLVVAKEGWHPGVVGIVASRVARHYNRPAIVMGVEEDGSARGSCRSIAEYDLLDGLNRCADLLGRFGGHRMAAGLEVLPGNMEAFRERFNGAAKEVLCGCDLTPVQTVDAVVDAGEIHMDFLEQLKQLRPFGQSQPEPVWALRGVQLAGAPRVVGQNHLKLALTANGRRFDAIAFNYPLENLPDGPLDVAFTLKENSWQGNTSLQLQVQDLRTAEPG